MDIGNPSHMGFLAHLLDATPSIGMAPVLFGSSAAMTESTLTQPSVFNRAWSQISRTVREIGPRKRRFEFSLKSELPKADEDRLIEAFQECIDHRGGEVQARARAAALGQAFLGLNEEGRRRFAELLAECFDVDHAAVDVAIEAVKAAGDDQRVAAEAVLRAALEAPRTRVLTQFNGLPEGVKFLVDLRAELLGWQRETPAIKGLQEDLRRLLANWFDVGFLELRQIDWSASAALLEKLIRYEAVHRIRSWDDLKNRLDSDRRCYAFFHPRMPDEPLIFVEVALVTGIAGDVGELLNQDQPADDPRQADTAIFYSISNAQAGLAGISFGDFLIKRVVGALSAELPNLKTFATLSPIPAFITWANRSPDEAAETTLSDDERVAILSALTLGIASHQTEDDVETTLVPPAEDIGGWPLIAAALALPGWQDEEALAAALEAPLSRMAADYLYNRKRGSDRCLDPVAHFHLSNGARMERLNWLGDRSGNGLRQSAGMMINYLYKLSEIDENHESYAAPDRRIVASSTIKSAAKR
jgi:malonyl-CoA decarboxylase